MAQRDLVVNVFEFDDALHIDQITERVRRFYGDDIPRFTLHVVLSHLVSDGKLFRLRRGVYCLPTSKWAYRGKRRRWDEPQPDGVVLRPQPETPDIFAED